MEKYKEEFIERTKKHIELVNKYAEKIDRRFPNHDSDKLTTLLDDYSLMKKKKVFGGSNSKDNLDGLAEEEQERLNEATLYHITHNPHHAEYWADESELKGFDRSNPPANLDCTRMPLDAIEEMCADWCAMSEEFGNSPFEWLEKTVPSRWVFSEKQVWQIKRVLEIMWGEDE